MSNTENVRTPAVPWRQLWLDEQGEAVVEYGLILAFISLAMIAATIQVGLSFEALWQALVTALDSVIGS